MDITKKQVGLKIVERSILESKEQNETEYKSRINHEVLQKVGHYIIKKIKQQRTI